MRTPTGFNLKQILYILCINGEKQFQHDCKCKSGGTQSYEDDLYGEQSFIYEFSNEKLILFLCTAEIFCQCIDINDCNCEDDAENEFTDWSHYWQSIHETIELSYKQIQQIQQPNLFEK